MPALSQNRAWWVGFIRCALFFLPLWSPSSSTFPSWFGGQEWRNVPANNNNIPTLCIGDPGLGRNMEHIQRLKMSLLEMEGWITDRIYSATSALSHFPSLPSDSSGCSCGLWQKLFPQVPFPLWLGVQLCWLGGWREADLPCQVPARITREAEQSILHRGLCTFLCSCIWTHHLQRAAHTWCHWFLWARAVV